MDYLNKNFTKYPSDNVLEYEFKDYIDKDGIELYSFKIRVVDLFEFALYIELRANLHTVFKDEANYFIEACKRYKYDQEEKIDSLANKLSENLKSFLEANFIDKPLTTDLFLELINKLGFYLVTLR